MHRRSNTYVAGCARTLDSPAGIELLLRMCVIADLWSQLTGRVPVVSSVTYSCIIC